MIIKRWELAAEPRRTEVDANPPSMGPLPNLSGQGDSSGGKIALGMTRKGRPSPIGSQQEAEKRSELPSGAIGAKMASRKIGYRLGPGREEKLSEPVEPEAQAKIWGR
jgi:hypothetical protein